MRRTFLLPLLFGLLAPAAASAQDEQPTNQIHYPLAEELQAVLHTADDAREAGKLEQAVELYRSVLDADGPSAAGPGVGYQVALLDTSPGLTGLRGRRFKGVTQWAIDGLRGLPEDGVALFRKKYDYRASSARDEALSGAADARDAFAALARVYELYPISSHAAALLERMGDLALEAGQLDRAHRTYARLVAHHEGELESPPRIRQKMIVCALGLGRDDEVRRLVAAIRRDDPEAVIHLAGEGLDVQELVARALEVRAERAAADRYTHVRADPANTGHVEAPVAFGAARFQPRVFDRPRVTRNLAGGRQFTTGALGQDVPARSQAVVHDGAAFVATADRLLAYDLDTGEERPRIPRLGPAFPDPNANVQFGGAIDRGTLVVPLVEAVLRDQQYRGIPIKVRIPIRKLAGFDLDRWRWTWNHARDLEGTHLEGWSFPTPPAARDGLMVASAFSIEGFVNCHVAAFESRTGEPLWDSWIASGQVEQTMFGEHATEPLCVPVGLADGIVYHATSFGCVSALDLDTGRILWVSEYDQIEVRAPRGYYADHRSIDWENNAPVVEAGVVVVAPLDSDHYYGFDGATGRTIWRKRRRQFAVEADMRYVIGAADGRVVLGGGHEVRCVDVRNGKLLWRSPLRGKVVSGRGVIAKDVVCVPVDDEVFLFDIEQGKRLGRVGVAATGNLLVCGEHIAITGSDGRFVVHRNRGFEGGADRGDRGGEDRGPRRNGRDF